MYCDVISRDVYLPDHTHSDYREAHEELVRITPADKLTALGENGPIPGLAALARTRVPWSWFMTWSKSRCLEIATSHEELRFAYNSEYGVTLDKLPALY
jgi:mannan endo-1,4-beta-mannosidase